MTRGILYNGILAESISCSDNAVITNETLSIKKLVRKVDLRLIPFLTILYIFSFLDRVNIGHARLYQLEKDLNLGPNEFSWTLSIFFIGYVVFEVPSNLMMKRTSPAIWISRIMITWGIITMSMAASYNFAGLMASRFFLGLAEAGLFPGIVFYLSSWYTRKEQGVRIASFFSASTFAGAFAGLIAYGIAYMNGVGGLKSWQWIFIIEGFPTVILGVITLFVLPSSPQDAKWLNEEEKIILSERLKEDHVELESKKFDKKQFMEAITDYKTYLFMLCFFGFYAPVYSLALLTPTILSTMGFSILNTFLLTIPPNLVCCVVATVAGWNSDRTMERGYHVIFGAIIGVAGFFVLIFAEILAVKYFGLILASSGLVSCLPPLLSWSNNNTIGSTKLATVSAMIISFGNIGGAISAPYYIPSHATNIAFAWILKWRYTVENQKLEAKEIPFDNKILSQGFRYIL
ncbi:MFS nicotinic acid transporter-like protein Tna1 [Neoconidiobolus thromboides FSU 785]|nr:MFS nicotinic acid transporter-like protein Tna1 [Neoconidiobolus thromboides FSU 785]